MERARKRCPVAPGPTTPSNVYMPAKAEGAADLMLPTTPRPVTVDDRHHTHTAHCLAELVSYARAVENAAKLAEDAQWAVFHHLLMTGTPMPELLKPITHGSPDPEDIDWYLKDYRRWLTKNKVRERHPARTIHSNAQKYLNYLENNA